MTKRHLYFALCILGGLVPMAAEFLFWLFQHGLEVPGFLNELFTNRISAFFALAVIFSVIAVCVLAISERASLPSRLWGLPVAATICVGVSLGLPLFLYLRESARS